MSVGDSLLDYFSEEELKKYKRKTAFKDKTYSRYLIINHKNHTKFLEHLEYIQNQVIKLIRYIH